MWFPAVTTCVQLLSGHAGTRLPMINFTNSSSPQNGNNNEDVSYEGQLVN